MLGVLLAAWVGVAAFVPQGWMADDLARLEHSEVLRALVPWGLTDVAHSPWLYALLALIAGNWVAMVVQQVASRREQGPEGEATPAVELKAPFPEHAALQTRDGLEPMLGRPSIERVEGSKVVLGWDLARGARLAPAVAHLGLVLLMVAAALASSPPPTEHAMARALLRVRDVATGSEGMFDLVKGDERQLFQNPASYELRYYVPDRLGLGPAIQLMRTEPNRAPSLDGLFWVYLNAPPALEAEHRGGEVVFTPLSMGIGPAPGWGIASRPEGVLLLAALALFGLGLARLGRPEGWLEVTVDGRQVRLTGYAASDEERTILERRMPAWAAAAEWSLDT